MPYKNIELNPAQYNTSYTKQESQFYKGYSSINVGALGSTSLYDFELVKQDFLNQFNTKQGERVMLPKYGTIIWSLIFEPFTEDVKQAIADDINRICRSDPRVIPIQILIDEQEYGMLLELTLQVIGSDQTIAMRLAFDKEIGLVPQ
jgi:phage baseplate assembly protein W